MYILETSAIGFKSDATTKPVQLYCKVSDFPSLLQ